MSKLLDLYNKLGNETYGEEIGKIAPYFSTISPTFINLKPGYCEIFIKDTITIHNHIGTIHAAALCNGAELVAGLCTDVSIPASRQWIPIGMQVKYLTKARGDIIVKTTSEIVDWSFLGEISVAVIASTVKINEIIFTATIDMNIRETPRKGGQYT